MALDESSAPTRPELLPHPSLWGLPRRLQRLVRWLTLVQHPDPARRVFGAVFSLVVLGLTLIVLANTILIVTPAVVRTVAASLAPCMVGVWWLNRRGHWSAPLITTILLTGAMALGFEPVTYIKVQGYPVIHVAFIIPTLVATLFLHPLAGFPTTLVTVLLLGLRALAVGYPLGDIGVFVGIATVDLLAISLILTLTAEMVARAIRQAADLTEHLERRVAERTGELQRLHLSWQEETAEVTHDLRSLMMAANVELEMLILLLADSTLTSDQLHEAFHRIRATNDIQAGLVSDLHTLSVLKANAHALVLRIEEYDLAERIRQMGDALVLYVQSKRLDLTMDVPNHLVVRADPSRMDRVLLNLVMNAIKFTRNHRPDGSGHIIIRLRRDGAWAELTITDNGIGITAAGLQQIGQRWVREQREGMPEGTGLGLNFSATIVALLHGTFVVDSPGEGLGTAVSVRLPAVDIASPPRVEADAPVPQP